MARPPAGPKADREKKLQVILKFSSRLANRFETTSDESLATDLESHIKGLPLQPSSSINAKRNELDRFGTKLWNLSTRLRREDPQTDDKRKSDVSQWNRSLCLLRVFSFFLLDAAGGNTAKIPARKTCIRLLKIALKSAKVSLDADEKAHATKVLERAADYQETLGAKVSGERDEEDNIVDRLRVEYFVVRTALAWRQDRLDMAEHMFPKCKQLARALTPSIAESLADLLYEVGSDLLGKGNYELGIRWLERAHDVLGEQDLEVLSAEAGDLRLSIMLKIAQGYTKVKNNKSRDKAWNMLRLLEADYEGKMTVSLLKLELLSMEEATNSQDMYAVVNKMIRTVLLNDRNFNTIMHHINKLKDHDSPTACKLIDELIELRLFREEKDAWLEKAVITRIWICCSVQMAGDTLEQLWELFDSVAHHMKGGFTVRATHAAQMLLWKRVDASCGQAEYPVAEKWCQLCLHSLFGKAGDLNKSKIHRKLILCAQARHDHAAARDIFSNMFETGRNECVTRYLMYKSALYSDDSEFLAECLDVICRQSTKDATLLYACVLEAQANGNNRHAIVALQKVLDKYDHSAPADVHLPALLRMTTRLLGKELVNFEDKKLNHEVLEQVCTVLEGACKQAKESRRKPSNAARDRFTASEFEWFSKTSYNWSIKYCAEMPPASLVRLLQVCIQFITLLNETGSANDAADLSLRLMFCHFLASCTYTTLGRAEDNIQDYLQYYLQVRKHGKIFRNIASENTNKLKENAQNDIVAKHFQVVKLELEAALKLEQWDEMDDLFDQCFKFPNLQQYEKLADLVIIIHSSMVKANLDAKYQSKILAVIQKIINTTHRHNGNNLVHLSRWIRCLFQLALCFDEKVSLQCIEQAIKIASAHQGNHDFLSPPPSSPAITIDDLDRLFADDVLKETNHYPTVETEWLATTSFNHAVDYYVQGNDAKCKEWAEKALALAGWAEDGGVLRGVMMEKYSGLTWGEQEG